MIHNRQHILIFWNHKVSNSKKKMNFVLLLPQHINYLPGTSHYYITL